MNYIDEIVAKLQEKLPDEEEDILRFYALLVLVTGEDTVEEDVHDAWSAYTTKFQPDRWSLVPFYQLTPDVQALDEPYVKAIQEVARGCS